METCTRYYTCSSSFALLKGSFTFLLLLVVAITLVLVLSPDVFSLRNSYYDWRRPLPLISSPSHINDPHATDDPGFGNLRTVLSIPVSNTNHTSAEPTQGISIPSQGDDAPYVVVKTILFWSGFYTAPASRWAVKMGKFSCGQYVCDLTDDHTRYNASDALMFHQRCPSFVKDITNLAAESVRPPNLRFVLYNRESASWTNGKDIAPVRDLVNWTMGYRRDNDIYIPTAVIKRGQYLDGYDPKKNYMEGKTGHTAVLMSMCNWGGYKSRSDYINLLRRSGLHVDILGNCGKKCGRDFKSCANLLRRYKFVLAFENTLCDDYISEKPYRNAFGLQAIPVVMSRANVSDPSILPPGSFINGRKFPNAGALVKHINKVGNDPTLYNSYFEWRANWTFTLISLNEGHVPFQPDYYCPLCEKLHSDSESKIIQNLQEWFEHEKCEPYPKQ